MTKPTSEKLRAWWAHQQGLDATMAGIPVAEVLSRTGWARSVGGSAPYLTLFARAGLSREVVDAAVAAQEVSELPSARGCTYLLPSTDFAVGLTVGAGAPEGDLTAAVKHLDVTRDEIEKLGEAVLKALGTTAEPLDPASIKREVGDAVRSLGEAGKKRGVSTTLPLTLGLLQSRGEIRKVPVNGRLDEQRFGYVAWTPSPVGTPLDPDVARTELARRYFRWAGPATLKHFRWFSGFTATAAKRAVASLDLVPVGESDLLLPADLVEAFDTFEVPEDPSYALVSWIDGIHPLHRELSRLLEPADAARPEPASARGRTLGHLTDPPCQLIVDRGRIVGLWEYDPGVGEIVHQLFVPADNALRASVARTEEFIREQLGDVRGMSLDSAASRAPRLAALRDGI